jgi:hypothetical protein
MCSDEGRAHADWPRGCITKLQQALACAKGGLSVPGPYAYSDDEKMSAPCPYDMKKAPLGVALVECCVPEVVRDGMGLLKELL